MTERLSSRELLYFIFSLLEEETVCIVEFVSFQAMRTDAMIRYPGTHTRVGGKGVSFGLPHKHPVIVFGIVRIMGDYRLIVRRLWDAQRIETSSGVTDLTQPRTRHRVTEQLQIDQVPNIEWKGKPTIIDISV